MAAGVAAVVTAVTVLLPSSHPAARPAHHAAGVTISSFMPDRVSPGGMFAGGSADGHPWQMSVQDIADPGARCQPGITLNGNDADPLFPGPPRLTPVGNPAFMTLGGAAPGVGFAFIQVPARTSWVWLDPGPIGGLQLGMQPATPSACGQRFRLVGFAYPLAATLRIHASTPASSSTYIVPSGISDPRVTLADPQINGVWQDADAAHAQVTIATLATGRAFGQRWSIQLAFGTAGDCFTLNTAYIDDSANAKPEQTSLCGPISTPRGPDTIMALALGSPAASGQGVGYVVSLGPDTASLTAQLSTGSFFSVTPVVAAGRRYAAFFVPTPPHLTWLNWVNAAGKEIAGLQDLPSYGYTQFP